MPEALPAVRLRVGANVQRLRRSRGLTQEQLSEIVGNTGKHLGQIERGEVNVGIDTLTRLASALEVDVTDLFAGGPRRRRPEPPLYLANARELDQIEDAIRSIRAAQVKARGDD